MAPAAWTRAAAHIGRPRSPPTHRHKKLRIPACASDNGNIRSRKQLSKSPFRRRERPVDGSTDDAVLRVGQDVDFRSRLALLTCAQGWANGCGYTQGTWGDDMATLEHATDEDLESWWLCVGS